MLILQKRILPALLVILILLLFVGGPGHYSNRIFRNIWDLGHIVLFIVFSISLFNLSFIERKKPYTQILIVFVTVIFFAIVSELLQLGTDRTPELTDIRKDIIGAFIGTLIFFRKNNLDRKLFLVLIFIAFILIAFELSALSKTLIDEYNILKTGTVLSNLESTFEDERWKGNSEYSISSDLAIEGKHSLRVIFNTDPYSGITLKYMHRDWSTSDNLHVSIFYPGKDNLLLNVRINDFLHVENNRYDDRFNKEIILANGWNHFVFSVQAIQSAPKERQTNLNNMQSFGMFVTNLNEQKTIYIDNIYLD